MWLLYAPVAALAVYIIYQRLFHPLARIPGPFFASITSFWITWQSSHQRRPRLDLNLHKQYGSVVRISPNEVIFSNPAYFKQVYGAGTKFTKGPFYNVLQDGTEPQGREKLNMLVETDIEKLRVQKRYAGPVYSTNNIQKHEHHIDDTLKRMIKRFNGLTGQIVDIYHEWEMATVDVYSAVTFGQEYGAVEKGTDDGHMAAMDKVWEWWGMIGNIPWLDDLEKRYARVAMKLITGNQNRHKMPVFAYAVGKIMEYDEAKAKDKEMHTPPCILNDLRQLSQNRPDFLPNWGTRLAMTDLGAGVDTTSWSLAAMIAGISNDRAVVARLRAELDAAIQAGTVSKNVPVPYAVAAKLEYLQACMAEAMRMWPNIAIGLPRDVPAEGIVLDGYYIPAGYTIGMNSKQLGVSEEIFGPDPQTFRPERWLEADRSRRNDMELRNLAFGAPSRKCPGMHLAWVVMSKLLASFYLNFDLKVLNELDGAPGPGGSVWREKGSFPTKWHGLEVELTER